MKNLNQFDDRVWEKFLSFLLPNEEEMTREEVQAELQRLNIDTSAAQAKLRQTLKKLADSRNARAALEAAKKQRPSLLGRMGSFASSVGTLSRDGLRKLIAERLSGETQAAYFRKLESAASEGLGVNAHDLVTRTRSGWSALLSRAQVPPARGEARGPK